MILMYEQLAWLDDSQPSEQVQDFQRINMLLPKLEQLNTDSFNNWKLHKSLDSIVAGNLSPLKKHAWISLASCFLLLITYCEEDQQYFAVLDSLSATILKDSLPSRTSRCPWSHPSIFPSASPPTDLLPSQIFWKRLSLQISFLLFNCWKKNTLHIGTPV